MNFQQTSYLLQYINLLFSPDELLFYDLFYYVVEVPEKYV